MIPRELAAMSREGVAGRPAVNTSFQRFEDASPDVSSAFWVPFQAYLPASSRSVHMSVSVLLFVVPSGSLARHPDVSENALHPAHSQILFPSSY